MWLSATSFANIPLIAPLSRRTTRCYRPRPARGIFRPFGKSIAVHGRRPPRRLTGLGVAGHSMIRSRRIRPFGIRDFFHWRVRALRRYLRANTISGTLFNHPADGGITLNSISPICALRRLALCRGGARSVNMSPR